MYNLGPIDFRGPTAKARESYRAWLTSEKFCIISLLAIFVYFYESLYKIRPISDNFIKDLMFIFFFFNIFRKCGDVEFTPEDASRSNREFLIQILSAVIKVFLELHISFSNFKYFSDF